MKRTLIIFFATVFLVSCSVYKQHPYNINNTQLNLHMDNLEYLGERVISVDYSTIFGIRSIEKINDVVYDGKVIKTAQLSNMSNVHNGILRRAMSAIYEEFPGADYIIVCNEKLDKNVLFLGSKARVEAKVKIYSLKN